MPVFEPRLQNAPFYSAQWASIGSPLSPHADDLRIYAQELEGAESTLLLGVTPQIAALPLRGFAVDHNLAMLQTYPPTPARWQSVHANWLALLDNFAQVGQVVGDGALSTLHLAPCTLHNTMANCFKPCKRYCCPAAKRCCGFFYHPSGQKGWTIYWPI